IHRISAHLVGGATGDNAADVVHASDPSGELLALSADAIPALSPRCREALAQRLSVNPAELTVGHLLNTSQALLSSVLQGTRATRPDSLEHILGLRAALSGS
ncbi:MAG: hypothetical protein AAFY60_12050, partial [Myxococcota bacterium]